MPSNHRKYTSIDSTNLEAIRLIKSGEISSDCVLSSKVQTAGRGRLDRAWESGAGNLFISIAKSISEEGIERAGENELGLASFIPLSLLPFLIALAVGETVNNFLLNRKKASSTAELVKYKWPNDILVDGKKISGILIEITNNYAVIGIGVNIAHYPSAGTKLPATCLNEYLQKPAQIDDFIDKLLGNFEDKLKLSTQEILADWVENAYQINKNVTISQENKEISGIYKGISENGELILVTNEGKRELILYGDVIFQGLGYRV